MGVRGLSGKIDQGHGSAETSLNQVPALMKRVSWRSGTKNLDVGGGKYEAATDYLRGHGVRNIVFDPFNRETAHNRAVYAEMRDGGVDTVTCCNVLNVIDGAQARANVILQCAKALKSGGVAYFSVYEGDKSGVGRRTKADCWQNNRRTESYVGEIERNFGKVERHGQVIEARKPIVTERKSEWNMDSEGRKSELFGIKRTTTKTNRTMATKKQLDALAKGRKMLAEKRRGEKGKKGTTSVKKKAGLSGDFSPRYTVLDLMTVGELTRAVNCFTPDAWYKYAKSKMGVKAFREFCIKALYQSRVTDRMLKEAGFPVLK